MDSGAPPRFPRIVIEVAADHSELASVELFELGAVGVEERDQSTLERSTGHGLVKLLASFERSEDADDAMEALRERYSPRSEDVIGDAWRDAWKEGFKPFRLTDTILICPPWDRREASAGEHVLTLEPGRAFGTGLHATTMLVARALERRCAELKGSEVLDVGCGTGILAMVALVHGAARARALDNDPDVIEVVEKNAELNGFCDRIEAGTTDVGCVAGTYPVVVANIEARVLIGMASALGARVGPRGLLVLSGVLDVQKDEVTQSYPTMKLEQVTTEGEWVALELRAGG